jgi:hypothetical protein
MEVAVPVHITKVQKSNLFHLSPSLFHRVICTVPHLYHTCTHRGAIVGDEKCFPLCIKDAGSPEP